MEFAYLAIFSGGVMSYVAEPSVRFVMCMEFAYLAKNLRPKVIVCMSNIS